MAWKIVLSQDAARELASLEKSDAARIAAKLEQAAGEPGRHFERLVGADDYKLRIGDYRIIALLFSEQQTVFVEKIGHRKNIYKKK